MFATGPQPDLNQSSAGNIPINSMYSSAEERTQAIPPPVMEGSVEEAIRETISEAEIETGHDQSPEQKKEVVLVELLKDSE